MGAAAPDPEETMFGLSRPRIVEIGVALLLTLAVLILVGLTVWAAESARIEVAGAWARPTVGEVKVSAAYMTILNKGETEDRLNGARAPKAEKVELHQTTMTADGVMQMREVVGGLPIEAGAELVLAPGGIHFMLLGLKEALLSGEELILTLEFDKAGSVDAVVPVRAGEPAGENTHDHSH
jgi:copper(I)-binding protein